MPSVLNTQKGSSKKIQLSDYSKLSTSVTSQLLPRLNFNDYNNPPNLNVAVK